MGALEAGIENKRLVFARGKIVAPGDCRQMNHRGDGGAERVSGGRIENIANFDRRVAGMGDEIGG